MAVASQRSQRELFEVEAGGLTRRLATRETGTGGTTSLMQPQFQASGELAGRTQAIMRLWMKG